MPNTVRLAKRAIKDLEDAPHADYRRLKAGIQALEAGGANVQIKPLTDARPWLEMRLGEYRLLIWPDRRADSTTFVVARIVNRRDLMRAVRNLAPPDVPSDGS